LTITVYGIRNCDTVKRARAWLVAHGIEHAFHDYKASGIDLATLQRWVGEVGWERLVNRSGTTFRKLPEAERAALDAAAALALMLAQPSVIRRPVLEGAGGLIVGFDAATYAARLARR
jgi:arsenate reductase